MTVYNVVDTAGTLSLVEVGQSIPEGGVIVAITSDPDYLNHPSQVESLISKFAFLQRFTEAELVAIELAKIHSASATQSQNEFAATLRMHQLKLDASKWVDLQHTETVTGLNGLEAAGLLSTGRANTILTTPIADDERP
jgi:hypothetical protein